MHVVLNSDCKVSDYSPVMLIFVSEENALLFTMSAENCFTRNDSKQQRIYIWNNTVVMKKSIFLNLIQYIAPIE